MAGGAVWGVFVDELKIFATASRGTDWWLQYSARQPDGRVTCLGMTPCGGHVHVACDDKDDARVLRDEMTGLGINPKFTRVRTLAACQAEASRREARGAARAERVAEQDKRDRPFREAWAWWTEHVLPDPLADGEGWKLALTAIGYPLPGFQDVVLRHYRARRCSACLGPPAARAAGRAPGTAAALRERDRLTTGEIRSLSPDDREQYILLQRVRFRPGIPYEWLACDHRGALDALIRDGRLVRCPASRLFCAPLPPGIEEILSFVVPPRPARPSSGTAS